MRNTTVVGTPPYNLVGEEAVRNGTYSNTFRLRYELLRSKGAKNDDVKHLLRE